MASVAGALSLTVTTTGATAMAPAVSQAGAPTSAAPNTTTPSVAVDKLRLNVRVGRTVFVIGAAQPGQAGLTARLQIRRGHRWRTIDRDRTANGGRYVLRDRVAAPISAPARVLVEWGASTAQALVGRLNAFRVASASWYGPGFYGNRLGCGGTLTAGRLGVAHKSLPCGTEVTLRHGRRVVRVPVIDRGPYVAGREYDLTQATARRLRFHGHGTILSTR
jgi:hypothetical protein